MTSKQGSKTWTQETTQTFFFYYTLSINPYLKHSGLDL